MHAELVWPRILLPTSCNTQIYETLDYDRCDNQLYRDRFVGVDAVSKLPSWRELLQPLQPHLHEFHPVVHDGCLAAMRELKKEQFKIGIQRWAFCAAIGALTAIVAFFIDFSVRLAGLPSAPPST